MLSTLANTIWRLLSRATAETLTLARIASAHLFWDSAGMSLMHGLLTFCEVIITNENVTSAMTKR